MIFLATCSAMASLGIILVGCGTPKLGVQATQANSGANILAQKKRPVLPQGVAFWRVDNNHDGRLSFFEFQQMGIFGVYGVGGGPANPNPSLADLQAMTFKILDRNSDNWLSFTEFKPIDDEMSKLPILTTFYEAVLPRVDGNKDGAFSLPEWQQLGQYGIHQFDFGTGNPNPTFAERQAVTFSVIFDRNRDGKVTLPEITEVLTEMNRYLPPSGEKPAET